MTPVNLRHAGTAILAVMAVAASPLAGQDRIDPDHLPRPTLAAQRVTFTIVLDGVIDEPAWFTADSTGDFLQSLPRDGVPASERSVVRVLYDDDNLYVGAVLYEREPHLVSIPGLEQDYRTENSDMLGVSIDTYHDRSNAFLFGINPGGAVFDAQNFNDSRYTNRAWEGVVHVKTQVQEGSWSVELVIPFTTLRFKGEVGEQAWGINFLRRIRRRGEDSYWSPLARQYRVHKMSLAGTLTGLVGLKQGRNLTIKPYVTGSRQTGNQALDPGNAVDGGADIKYGVTSRLTLDLSVNTDFSQAEVDQEQVNLTRFSVFFPEQRDFFLENDGVFGFGDVQPRNYRTGSSSRDYRLFHSRRIGLSDSRQALPVGGGGRLTGRAGDFELGFLSMQTQSSGPDPAENFSVGRVRRNLLGNSDIGVMFVNRQGTGSANTAEYNRSYGVDANFQVASKLVVNAYAAATDEPGRTGDNRAAWFQVAWRDRLWDLSGFVRHVGDGYNPGAGFVRRSAIRAAFATVGAHPQPNLPGVAEINPYIDLHLVGDLNWNLESRNIKAGTRLAFVPGDAITLEATDNLESLVVPDVIAGVSVPAGVYTFRDVSLRYQASGARWISGDVGFSHGGFYGGTRTSVGGRLVVRPSYHLQLDLTAEHNDLEIAGQAAAADLFGVRARYALNTAVFASAFVQYNRSANEMVSNLRFNLIHAPLSDVFVVVTDRRDLDDSTAPGQRILDRVIAFKFTRLFGF